MPPFPAGALRARRDARCAPTAEKVDPAATALPGDAIETSSGGSGEAVLDILSAAEVLPLVL